MWHRAQFHTLNSLRNNGSIGINRPDIGYGFVVLDYQNYVDKVMTITEDTKLSWLVLVDTSNRTVSIDAKF